MFAGRRSRVPVTFRAAKSPKQRRAAAPQLQCMFVTEAMAGRSLEDQRALVSLAADLGIIDDEQAAIIRRTVIDGVAYG